MFQPTSHPRLAALRELLGTNAPHPIRLSQPSITDLLADYRAAADALRERLQAALPRGLPLPLPDAAQPDAGAEALGALVGIVVSDALTTISLLVRDERSGKTYTVPLALLARILAHRAGRGADGA